MTFTNVKSLHAQEFDVPGLTLMGVSSMEEVVKHMTLGKQNRYVRPVCALPLAALQAAVSVYMCVFSLSDH